MALTFAQQLLANPIIYKISKKVYYELTKFEDADIAKLLSPDKKVIGGIFKGLTYPDYQSSGSSLFTKIIGSYEDELDPFFGNISLNKYSEIIDIGCAEGYYAVGLSMLHPLSKIYAFDIDSIALDRCKKMAEVNDVFDRINFGAKCDKSTLKQFQFTGRGLIICDCEGYEAELFDAETASVLKNSDLVIELHDNVVPKIKSQIENAFSKTHKIAYIESKLKSIKQYPVLSTLPTKYQEDKNLIERGTMQEWAIITATNL